MRDQQIQKQLFSELQNLLGEQINLAQWLQDELGFSKNCAYRSLNNERSLSLSESLQIMQLEPKLYLRLNQNLKFRDRILIRISNFNCEDSFQDYLRNITKVFKKAVASDKAQLKYIARDLPIFYFLARPRLLEYKYAYWQGSLRDQGPQHLTNLSHQLAQEVYRLYLQVPSHEIWHPFAYKQQQHLLATALHEGSVNEKEAQQIQSDLDWLTEQLKEHLFSGRKSEEVSLEIFDLAERSMENGGILRIADQEIVMSALPVARFYSSAHPDLVGTFQRAFKDHRRRAKGISAEGKAIRVEWLNKLNDGFR